MMREPGGEQREVFHATSGNALGTSAVSPDAGWVAVIQTNDVARTNTLSVAPVAGGAAKDLLAVKRPERLQVNPGALAWTADGRHLIFEKRVGSTYELWRIPVAGGAAERIGIGATRDIYFLRISPDGKRIAYVIGDVGENQWQVWEMKLGPLK